MWSQNLGLVILVDPLKLGIFYGSVILWKRLPGEAKPSWFEDQTGEDGRRE